MGAPPEFIQDEIRWLVERGVSCVKFSEHHYRAVGSFDFWPSSGKWKEMHGRRAGRGKETLLKVIRSIHGKSAPRLDVE
jgi:hypothetical protein